MSATTEILDRRAAERSERTGDRALAVWQVAYEQRAFWRNRTRAFFNFALPDGVGVGDLPAFDGGRADEPAPGRVRLVTTDGLRTAHAITGWAIERGHELRGFAVSQPSLEDVYLRLTDNREAARR